MFSRLQRWFGNGWMGIAELLITVFCVFLSLSFHEYMHGYAAYRRNSLIEIAVICPFCIPKASLLFLR